MIRLPNPPTVYDQRWANQYTRELETTINQLQNQIQQLLKAILPNYTTTEKDSLDATTGQGVFDTTLGKSCVYNGTTWETITSV